MKRLSLFITVFSIFSATSAFAKTSICSDDTETVSIVANEEEKTLTVIEKSEIPTLIVGGPTVISRKETQTVSTKYPALFTFVDTGTTIVTHASDPALFSVQLQNGGTGLLSHDAATYKTKNGPVLNLNCIGDIAKAFRSRM
jgi:hypothetical protein